ncbi:recombinase family protein [Enterobacter kobei]|uniref:recombinase family protein n=1 Tax=Enterobacter kobei TaxID=208224 RepID=UPI002021BCB3|nr:recombinase family protein [Enterobacter kobei]MCL8167138.1 recombinase family protein [Enterobacter kobei]MCM7795634.1 recombinase family protein [Enterobacter kobei]
MKPRLYSYVRFSSERQSKGSSVERQKSNIDQLVKKIALEHNLEIFEEYQDFGVSAFKGKNATEGALSEFIKHVDSGKIPRGSYLLIESLDRFSRANAMRAVNMFTSLLLKGIVVITGIDNQVYRESDYSNDTLQQLMFSVMLFSRANEESATKSHRTISSALMKIKRHQQRQPGDPVVAIKELGLDKWWTDSSSGFVKPHPVYFPIAQKLIELKQKGYSNRLILAYLQENHPAPTEGKSRGKWNMQHASRIIEPAIHGQKVINVNGEKFVLDDYYPAITTKEEYERLKFQIGNKSFAPLKEKNPEIPLLSGIGILYCKHCGCHMFKMKSTVKNQPYAYRYVCASRDSHRNCSKWGFRASTLERALLQLLADRVFVEAAPVASGVEHLIREIDEQIANYLVAIGSAKSPAMINRLTETIDQLEAQKAEYLKQKQIHDDQMIRMNTAGWDKFKQLDLDDTQNVDRLEIRASIKTVIKRIDCERLDTAHNYFFVTYRDERTQKIVIKKDTAWTKGKTYVDSTTVTNEQLLESEGLVMHSHIEIMINPEEFHRKHKEIQQRIIDSPTLIDKLTE